MTIHSQRLQDHFEAMSLIGKIGETGTCRPTMTVLEKEAFQLASSWMQEAGMTTHIDNFGNLIGRLQGTNPALPVLMMGSHLDSQPYGGRFDGVAGVLCAIEAVTTLVEKGIKPARSIEIISFADEEGWRRIGQGRFALGRALVAEGRTNGRVAYRPSAWVGVLGVARARHNYS